MFPAGGMFFACSGLPSGAAGSRACRLVETTRSPVRCPPVRLHAASRYLGRPSLAAWRRVFLTAFTRCVPGRFPGPLHSAGTGRFAARHTRRLSGDGRLGGMPGGVPLAGRGRLGAFGRYGVLGARTARCAGVRGHCPRRVLTAFEVAVLGAFLKMGVCVRGRALSVVLAYRLKRRRLLGAFRHGVLLGVDSVLMGVLLGAVARVAYRLVPPGRLLDACGRRVGPDLPWIRAAVCALTGMVGAALCAPVEGGHPLACRLAPGRRSAQCGQPRAAACGGARPVRCAAALTGVVLDAAAQGRWRRRWPRRSPGRDAAGSRSPRCGWWPSGSCRAASGCLARGSCSAPVGLAFCSVQGPEGPAARCVSTRSRSTRARMCAR